MEPHSFYVICTNPRSGSWLLSEGLEATKLASQPREWFHESTEEEICNRAGIALPAQATYEPYLQHLLRIATTANGIFGMKLHYYQFESLPAKLRTLPVCRELPQTHLLSAVFPSVKHLWLTRRDKARQAVSYHRACQTDGWWQKEGQSPPRRPGTVAEAVFDAQRIERLENLLVSNELNWQRYFQQARAEPLVVTYEEVSADYAGVIRRVLQWLGVAGAEEVVVPPPALKKQADEVTEEWVERYSRFKAGRPASRAADSDKTAAAEIPDSWKRWIGENKLVKNSDASIVETLTNHGFPREIAAAEVERAAANPYLQAGEWAVQRLKKTESLLGVYRALAKLRPPAGAVERRLAPSRDEFLDRYYMANRPVMLEGLMAGWKALRAWTPDYLKGLLGREEVEIMAGREADANYEINSHQHRRKVPFEEYVDMVHGGAATNDYYLVANNAFFKRAAARRLLDDIEIFPEYLDARRCDDGVFFWYGPAGTVTPLHHDTSNIFMAQVWGRKRIKLISPNDSEFLYNDIGVFSPVDCDKPDLARWPQYRQAEVTEVVLSPGETLFIPVGWWHHVRSLDVSLTISFTNFVFANRFEWKMPQIRKT